MFTRKDVRCDVVSMAASRVVRRSKASSIAQRADSMSKAVALALTCKTDAPIGDPQVGNVSS